MLDKRIRTERLEAWQDADEFEMYVDLKEDIIDCCSLCNGYSSRRTYKFIMPHGIVCECFIMKPVCIVPGCDNPTIFNSDVCRHHFILAAFADDEWDDMVRLGELDRDIEDNTIDMDNIYSGESSIYFSNYVFDMIKNT